MGTESLLGVKRPERGADLLLVPGYEWICATPLPAVSTCIGMPWGDLNLLVIITKATTSLRVFSRDQNLGSPPYCESSAMCRDLNCRMRLVGSCRLAYRVNFADSSGAGNNKIYLTDKMTVHKNEAIELT